MENTTEIKNFKVELISRYKQDGVLIPLLQAAQDSYGYIPEKVIVDISEIVEVAMADIYGVITFYSQFRLKPLGKNVVKICEGTACHVNGAKGLLSSVQNELGISVDETTDDGKYTLQSVACLGCCSLAPAVMIGDETHGKLSPDKIRRIIKSINKKD